jgi:putative endonuclease
LISSLFDGLRHRIRRKRWEPQRANGARAEDLAMRFLQARKFTVVARNYRPRSGHGEIDIVAWDKDTLVFVEVKSAMDDERGTPDRAIDRHKRERLEWAARDYLHKARVLWEQSRFDIVTVVGVEKPVIEHYPAAW